MFRFLKNHKSLASSYTSKLQKTSIRFSSNYYGALNKFKFTDNDFKPSSPVQSFIEKYRKHGHHFSQVDPLELGEKYNLIIVLILKSQGSNFHLYQNSSLTKQLH